VNLNQPKVGIHKPEYRPEDIIKQYSIANRVIKSVDPGAILAGPCCSSIIKNFDWNIPLFKQGLFKHLDAFNFHGYHTPPPEEGQVVEQLRRMRQQIRKYNNGKNLDMYCTELGYRSQYGSQDKHKEHALWHTRIAVILKGEGVKVYFPFYSYDYRGDNSTWGVCYNLTPKLDWGPKRVSPKSAVPALAVCVKELEETVPVTDLPFFGRDIWCYVFKDKKTSKPVITIWSVHDKHKLKFPAGNVKKLYVTDIMGRRSEVKVKNGFAELNISPALIYLRGADPALYATAGKVIGKLYPGEKAKVKISENDVSGLKYWGNVNIKPASGTGYIEVKVPSNISPGPIPLLISGDKVKWLVIREPLKIEQVGLKKVGEKLGIVLSLKNMGSVSLPTNVSFDIVGMKELTVSKNLPARSTLQFYMPLNTTGKIDSGKPLKARIKIKAGNLAQIVLNKKFSLLAAHLRGEPGKDKLPNSITWKGKGASGKIDKATATFQWDSRNLYIQVKVSDDRFHQTRTDGTIWKMDSLQVAFDTHPELSAVYAPLAGVFTKKITYLDFAKIPNRKMIWRDISHNPEELKLYDVTQDIGFDFVRDKAKHETVYKLAIPWKEIGLDTVKKGKTIGVSILVNDSDGVKTRRAGLELFSGIMRGKNYRLFGVINLI
jgi:Carbohydrate family 9 binding domain-like